MAISEKANAEAAASDELREALDAAADIVGRDRVAARFDDQGQPVAGDLGNNSGLFRSRRVFGVIRPRSSRQVQQVVEAFGRSAGAGSLHVYSTGRNWGLGSREPARDDAVALDLGGLDEIRSIDVGAGWAIIEPGVTQGQMFQQLVGTDRMVNITSSSAHSSVLGNALERGVGMRRQRDEDLVGLEVVLPDGEIMHVGWWPDPARPTPVYAHGLGPSLVQTFVQSTFGVVTAAAIRLLPRPEALRVVRLNFASDRHGEAITLMRRWVAQGLVSGVLKVYNPLAARSYGTPAEQFLAHVCIDGTAAAVDALAGVVTAEADASGIFSAVSATDSIDPGSEHHEATTSVERAYGGDPDVTDRAFEARVGPADKLDDNIGFLGFVPLVPFTPEAAVEAESLLHRVHAETGNVFPNTLNVLGPDLANIVVNMPFQRTEEAAARAHRALDMLYELFTAAGFLPYRLDVDHHHWIDRCGGDEAERRFVRRLKDAVDPMGVIARGRYC